MSDLVFVAAAYSVILGGLAAYAWLLVRRLRRAERALTDASDGTQSD